MILARGTYPTLAYAPDRLWGTNSASGISLDFTCWREVRVIHEHFHDGPRSGLTVSDGTGHQTHRVLLNPSSDAAYFHDLVHHHGSRAVATEGGISSTARAPWQSKLAGRSQWLSEGGSTTARRLPSNLLASLFQTAQAEGLGVSAGVYTKPAIQRHPLPIERVHQEDGQLLVCGPNTALHLQPAGLEVQWLVGGRCACCGEDRWSVEAYDSEGALALTLQSSMGTEEATWREMLLSLANSL